MSDLEKQKKLTDGKGWKGVDFSRESPYKVLTEEKKDKKKHKTINWKRKNPYKLKEKVKKIAKPFIEESVAIKSLSKKDKD